jgi:phospholipase C
MATQRHATVEITNNSGGNAQILLFHNNRTNGTQRGSWAAGPGQTVGPLTAYFESGWDAGDAPDWWSVLVHVKDGPTPGLYISTGSSTFPYWKECQFQDSDESQTMTFAVSATEFDINLYSGTCKGGMTKLAPRAPITHVFVVMLENRSFDSMFAMSGIKGITAATTKDFNSYNDKTYNVQSSAPLSLPTDPGHEFLDVVEQLGGEGAQKKWQHGGPYPPINNSGFVANYATTTDELTGLPPEADFGDVMACFATPNQLPVLYQLAIQFALCDQWHSSLPGLTWPNRFFLHGASSSGMDANPSTGQIEKWELSGFTYPNGSIYDALNNASIPYRFYNDTTGGQVLGQSLYSDDPAKGSAVGAVPQVTSLHGVQLAEIYSLEQFASDLQGPYPYPYTFIEPHYGNVRDNTYEGGSSQHPMDDVYGGEHLLAAVYAAIRNSPYWDTSLLLITYDEHGGLYDKVAPVAATPPGDNPPSGYNVNGFKFDLYGVRVPAIVVSPLIPAGTVDHTLYDHSSVLKTLEDLFELNPLTNRDAAANSVLNLLSLKTPRTDCPTSLNGAAPLLMAARPRITAEERALLDAQPVPESGNLVNALHTLRKAHIELSGRTPPEIAAIHARFEMIQTRGDAEAYALSVLAKARLVQEQRKLTWLRPSLL